MTCLIILEDLSTFWSWYAILKASSLRAPTDTGNAREALWKAFKATYETRKPSSKDDGYFDGCRLPPSSGTAKVLFSVCFDLAHKTAQKGSKDQRIKGQSIVRQPPNTPRSVRTKRLRRPSHVWKAPAKGSEEICPLAFKKEVWFASQHFV